MHWREMNLSAPIHHTIVTEARKIRAEQCLPDLEVLGKYQQAPCGRINVCIQEDAFFRCPDSQHGTETYIIGHRRARSIDLGTPSGYGRAFPCPGLAVVGIDEH